MHAASFWPNRPTKTFSQSKKTTKESYTAVEHRVMSVLEILHAIACDSFLPKSA